VQAQSEERQFHRCLIGWGVYDIQVVMIHIPRDHVSQRKTLTRISCTVLMQHEGSKKANESSKEEWKGETHVSV
jgi:hypothetical protein